MLLVVDNLLLDHVGLPQVVIVSVAVFGFGNNFGGKQNEYLEMDI